MVIYGAGPVGPMAAHTAQIKGTAAQVFVVDHRADRLEPAEQVGAAPVGSCSGDTGDKLTELTRGGADRGVDAVDSRAHDVDGEEHPEIVLEELIQVVKPTGGIGVVRPRQVRLHAAAPAGYDHGDKGEDGRTKVVLHPAR